jgi:hypothetical protein
MTIRLFAAFYISPGEMEYGRASHALYINSIKSKKKTKDEDYEFPLQIPYIAKIQDRDKTLMKESMKSDHKY